MERKSSKEYWSKAESSSFESCPQRTSSSFHGGALVHNRVSKVFKGFKVSNYEHYGQRNYVLKWKFNLCH